MTSHPHSRAVTAATATVRPANAQTWATPRRSRSRSRRGARASAARGAPSSAWAARKPRRRPPKGGARSNRGRRAAGGARRSRALSAPGHQAQQLLWTSRRPRASHAPRRRRARASTGRPRPGCQQRQARHRCVRSHTRDRLAQASCKLENMNQCTYPSSFCRDSKVFQLLISFALCTLRSATPRRVIATNSGVLLGQSAWTSLSSTVTCSAVSESLERAGDGSSTNSSTLCALTVCNGSARYWSAWW